MTMNLTRRHMVAAMFTNIAIIAPTAKVVNAQDATQAPASESELAPQLPPVDLPTMNQLGYTFELESVWQGDSDSVPRDSSIYRFTSVSYSEEDVSHIADTLGVDGEITSQGEDTYTVEGEGSIYTTPGLLQFTSAVEGPDEEMPDDQSAIAYARDWLRISDLLPPNIGEGTIVARIEQPARLIVGFTPADPSPLLSSTPGITVTVGPGGSILEARLSWADITEAETFRLRGVDDAFTLVESRQSYLDVDLPTDTYPQGSTIKGIATYDKVSIAYTTSGAVGQPQYLQPVYVFTGDLQPEGSDESFDITAYVPAIVTGQQPVG